MIRRTTIEIDSELLERARRAVGAGTARATVHEALRRAADAGDADNSDRASRQRAYLARLADHADLEVLASEAMWR